MNTKPASTLRQRIQSDQLGTVGLLAVIYIILVVTFALLSPFFLTYSNISNILGNMAFIGIMAAAQTPLIISGGLDLSSPAVAGLSGVIVGLLAANGVDVWVAAAIALGVGAAIGAANAALVLKVGVNPFIATLGEMSIIEGGALVLTGGLSKPLIEPAFNYIGNGRIAGFPVVALFMLMAFVIIWYMLGYTRRGKYIYAAGGNPEAARIAGVPVGRIQAQLYIFSSLSGAVAGVLLAARLGVSAPTAASASLLTMIAAVILGGTSLLGGRGFALGTFFAVLILGTLNNALVILGVSSFWQKVTHGVVLLLAVGIDQYRSRARSK